MIFAEILMALLLGAGLVRLNRENRRVNAELVRVTGEKAELDAQLSAVCSALRESQDREFEQGLELQAYRAEEQRGERAREYARKAMAN